MIWETAGSISTNIRSLYKMFYIIQIHNNYNIIIVTDQK